MTTSSTLVWTFQVHENYTEMLGVHAEAWTDALRESGRYGTVEFAGTWSPAHHRHADRHLMVGGLTREARMPEGNVTIWYPEQPTRAKATIKQFLQYGRRVLVPYNNYPIQGCTFFPSYYHPHLDRTTTLTDGKISADILFYGWPTQRRIDVLKKLETLLSEHSVRFVWWHHTGPGYREYLNSLALVPLGLCMASWDESIFYPVRIISELLTNRVAPIVERRCLQDAYPDILPFCKTWEKIEEIPKLLTDDAAEPGVLGQGHVKTNYDLRDLVIQYPVFDR